MDRLSTRTLRRDPGSTPGEISFALPKTGKDTGLRVSIPRGRKITKFVQPRNSSTGGERDMTRCHLFAPCDVSDPIIHP